MKSARSLIAAGLTWFGVLVFLVAPAFAGVGHHKLSEITGLARPWGLTFDSGGNLFVANTQAAEGEVRVFNTKNEEQAPLGQGALSSSYARSVVVDNATGYVYVADSGPDGVYVFKPIGGGLYENIAFWRGEKTTAGSFGGGYVSVAVDNNAPSVSDPHGGDVYVEASSNNAIDILKPNPPGPTETEEVFTGELESPPEGLAPYPNVGMAVDTSGDVYVPNNGSHAIDEFNGSGKFIEALTGAETPPKAFGNPIAVAVDDTTGDLYVVDEEYHVVDEFESSGKYLTRIAGFREPLGVAVQNATGPSQGDVYIADGEAGVVDIFGPNVTGPEPLVTTEAPSATTPTTAMLTGTVNPEGSSTAYWFEYGPTSSYGSETAHEPAGEGSTAVQATAELSSLEPHKTYHYRLTAENAFGAAFGADKTVTTASEQPAIEGGSESAGAVGPYEATLHARINPENETTHYYFEYGTSPTLVGASKAPMPAGELAGTSDTSEPVEVELAELRPSTVYYYRVVAENGGGKNETAAIESFATGRGRPVVTTESASSVSALAATVTGTISTEELETTFHYEYGATEAYGQSTTTSSAGSAAGNTAVVATLEDLRADTVYHYRLVATNDIGTSYGADQTLTTPTAAGPAVITNGAGDIGTTSATISGSIETQDVGTTYGFEVSTEAGAYDGSLTGVGSVAPGVGEATVTLTLQNLQSGTTYHYRVVASNLYGTSTGADQSFTTPGIPSPLSQPPTAPLVATPAIAFPTEPGTATTTVKTLTKAQKLAKAMKACERKPKKQRASCVKQAERQYGPTTKKKAVGRGGR